jgi:quercetin dioxygenase-like cupin family protein
MSKWKRLVDAAVETFGRIDVVLNNTVGTELPDSITEHDVSENSHRFYEAYARSFARAVAFAIRQPEDVDVNVILFRPTCRAPARTGGAYVSFEPCARSDSHARPLGQTLIVTFGCGLHPTRGRVVEEIRPGDVVSVGPNEKHWHGASPTTAMTHVAIQEWLDGNAADWLEQVTNEQYQAKA